MPDVDHAPFMRRAIALARQSAIVDRTGSPFGCVIVRDGEIVGEGVNQVPTSNDPTAHAEVIAIRDACTALGTYVLSGCTAYTTGEPCPMCRRRVVGADRGHLLLVHLSGRAGVR